MPKPTNRSAEKVQIRSKPSCAFEAVESYRLFALCDAPWNYRVSEPTQTSAADLAVTHLARPTMC
jgi:hypothetical protein